MSCEYMVMSQVVQEEETCEYMVISQEVQVEETTIKYSLGHSTDTVLDMLDWKVQVEPNTIPFHLLTVR